MSNITIHESNDINCSNIGLGVLSEAIKCEVTKTIDNQWECVFQIPVGSLHYEEIAHDRKIKVYADEKSGFQQFRIYKISKPDLKGIVKVYCEHISYDLGRLTVKPTSTPNINATTAISTILTNCVNSHNFIGQASTVSGNNTLYSKTPRKAREWICGAENSIKKLYDCEIDFNNYEITAKDRIGEDNGVKIMYGKNLSQISEDQNSSAAVKTIYPYAIVDDNYYELTNKKLDLPNSLTYGEERCVPLDLSNEFESGSTITQTQLQQKAFSIASRNAMAKIPQSIRLSFVQLWKTKEYETLSALERVGLGDTVHIYFEKYDIDASLRCIKTVYDPLNEKYISIELGDAKSNLGVSLATQKLEIDDAIKKQKTIAQQMIEHQTALISGGLGGYIVNTFNQDGYPDQILIMNTPDVQTATQVLRINKNGIGFSDSYDGQMNTAWAIDGTFNASYITTGTLNADLITSGTLNANLIKAGMLSDTSGNFSLNMTNGQIIMASDNSGSMQLWRQGFTLYHPDDSVAASMFLSAGNVGVLTSEQVYVGIRDSEKVRLYVSNDEGIVETDKITARGNNTLSVISPLAAKEIDIKHNTTSLVSIYDSTYIDGQTQQEVLQGTISISKGRIEVGNTGSGVAIDTDSSGNNGIVYSDQVLIRNANGLQMGGQMFGPVTITINGTNYTLIGQRNT